MATKAYSLERKPGRILGTAAVLRCFQPNVSTYKEAPGAPAGLSQMEWHAPQGGRSNVADGTTAWKIMSLVRSISRRIRDEDNQV
ncbi:hypothetical protein GCM10017711_16840 [Paeniglutamicibacter sulfureus]